MRGERAWKRVGRRDHPRIEANTGVTPTPRPGKAGQSRGSAGLRTPWALPSLGLESGWPESPSSSSGWGW